MLKVIIRRRLHKYLIAYSLAQSNAYPLCPILGI
jgi:hypothetical protein